MRALLTTNPKGLAVLLSTTVYMPSSFIFNRQSSRIRLKCDSWLRLKFTHKIF